MFISKSGVGRSNMIQLDNIRYLKNCKLRLTKLKPNIKLKSAKI